MNIKILFFSVLTFFSVFLSAQQNFWSVSTGRNIGEVRERGAIVNDYQLFKLDVQNFKNKLSTAPDRDQLPRKKGISIQFPNASGHLEIYEVVASSNMHPDLQSKYSTIRSYMGVKSGDPLSTVRFTIDPYFGLSASFKNENGSYYIDAYNKDNTIYMVYDRKNASSKNNFDCLVNENAILNEIRTSSSKTVDDGFKRRYRLAITTSTEYSNYVATAAGVGTGTDVQKKTAILAAVNLAVARLNQIFENDISSRLILIPDTDLLFFLTTDTFDAPNTGQMLDENIAVTDAIIGSANYDIGHIFYQGGGGGLAATPSICGGSKAGGVTGTTIPVGDPFVIDYVAHEMGHQFGANHTQNNACNRSANTSVEPGSGSTIMGYAGICAPDVQGNSDAYFHAISVQEMYNRITTGGNCALNILSGNTEPTSFAGKDKTIPRDTPFALSGQGSDPDGDIITYAYEQTDKEVAPMPPKPTSTDGPLFRSITPTTSNVRYFPRLSSIVQGYDATISAPGDFRAWEKLPSVGRIINFSLLVRDNNLYGGQTARSNVKLTVNAGSGPFIVTSQNTANVIWKAGKSETITWNVANTSAAPVNAPNVMILLSKDNGLSFPIVLVQSTPNDGSYTFDVPLELGIINNTARIMIKAIDNVFLNVNSFPFSILSTIPSVPSSFLFPEIVVYPVPSYDGIVYIRGLTTYDLTYSVYAMDGKLITLPKVLLRGDVSEIIDLTAVPKGVYVVKMENETGIINKKIIIAK